MELFRSTNIDWLGKKWYFLGFSLIFSVAGVLSMLFWHDIPLGVDFKGGTQIRCTSTRRRTRTTSGRRWIRAGVQDATIQRVSDPSGHAANKVIIALPESTATDQAHDAGRAGGRECPGGELPRLRLHDRAGGDRRADGGQAAAEAGVAGDGVLADRAC